MSDESKPASDLGSAPTLASRGAELGELPLPPLRPVDVDRYEFLGEHGRGGLGVIIRALDRQLGREVAIKLLRNPSPEAGVRFLREATITSRLQHPSIVTVLDVVRWVDGMPSYTMPLYPGDSLKVAIERRPELGERLLLLPRVLAVAEALAHAHERRIVHRDVKPANVLLGALGETVVIDWGLAKSLDDSSVDKGWGPSSESPAETRVGQVMGTPAYMPPEQAAGERVDERADVYALGALLFHVLSGQAPTIARDTGERIAQLEQARAGAEQPAVPIELIAILRKAMASDKHQRYRHAGALATDLRRFLDGHLVEAHAYTRAQLLWRWLVRYRALASVVLAALAVVVVVTAVSFRRVQREQAVSAAAALREEARANRLVLEQARSLLERDPTQSLAWLKTYPEAGGEWHRVRGIAREAVYRGVARHVFWPETLGEGYEPLPWDDGQGLVMTGSRREVFHFDLTRGEARIVCLPGVIQASPLAHAGGQELIVGLDDGQVQVLDAELHASTIARLPGVTAAALSSDGRYAAIAGEEGPARLIDRQSGLESPIGAGDFPIHDLVFLPRSDLLLLWSRRGRLDLYDVGQGQVVYSAAPGVFYPTVSPHGRYIVLVRRSGLEWIDTETWRAHALPGLRPGSMRPIGIFPDGRVALSERSKTSKVWTPASGRLDDLVAQGGPTAASPDGKQVAVLGSGELRLLEPGASPRLLRMPTPVLSRAVEYIGQDWLATASEGDAVRIWPTASPRGELVSLGGSDFAPPYDVMGDVLVAAGQDGRIVSKRLGKDAPLAELARLSGPVSSLAVGKDARHGLAVDGKGRLLAWQAGGEPREVASGVPVLDQLVYSPDERHAVGFGFSPRALLAWELASGRELRLGELEFCTDVLLSPAGRWAVFDCSPVGGDFTRVDLASLTAAPLSLPGDSDSSPIGFSPDGAYFFVGTGDGEVIRFATSDWSRQIRRLGRRAVVGGVALSGQLLVLAGEEGLFLASFTGLRFLVDADRRPAAVTRGPGDDFLVGRSTGGQSVWDLHTFERAFMNPSGNDSRRTRLLSGGRIGSSYLDGSIRVWTPDFAGPGTTSAATRAWLDQQTNLRVGDEDRPRLGCD